MKKIILVLIGLTFSNLALSKDNNFHIYLAFGQSNMEGQGEISSEDRVVPSRIKVMQNFSCENLNRKYGQWYTAEPPLFGCWGKLGIVDYFSRIMLSNASKDVSIGIVPTAIGGSDIALFQKSAPIGKGDIGTEKIPSQFSGGYEWLLDLALKAQQNGVIKGIIFHQGETNTADPEWKFKVKEIVNDLRTDLNLDDVPFLSGELLYTNLNGCCGIHNSEIAQLPGIINNTHVVSAEGLGAVDNAHFSAESYRELGKRYGEIMLPLISAKIEVDDKTTSEIAQTKTSSGGALHWYMLSIILMTLFNRLLKQGRLKK